MKKIILYISLLLLLPVYLYAACPGSSPAWTCSSWADLESCVEGAHTACAGFQDGDVISIDSGGSPYTASSTITITDPMTIDGGGTYSVTGTPPTDDGTWPVEIQGDSLIVFAIQAALNDVVILSGVEYTGTCVSGYNGCITANLTNLTDSFEIYDNYFNDPVGYAIGLNVTQQRGLIYNNYFYGTTASATSIRVKDTDDVIPETGDHVHQQMTNAVDWGGSTFTFIEDNTFYSTVALAGSAAIDASNGAKVVIRYNYFYNSLISVHGMTDDTPQRGALALEVYNNTFKDANPAVGTGMFVPFGIRSGTSLFYNNTIDGYQYMTTSYIERNSDGVNGWGACADANPWDGSGDPTGYPCLDQPGWATASGYSFTYDPDTSDIQTQTLYPMYYWDNTMLNGTPETSNESSGYITENTDYYICTGSCTETNDYPTGYSPYTYPHPWRGPSIASGIAYDQNGIKGVFDQANGVNVVAE